MIRNAIALLCLLAISGLASAQQPACFGGRFAQPCPTGTGRYAPPLYQQPGQCPCPSPGTCPGGACPAGTTAAVLYLPLIQSAYSQQPENCPGGICPRR